MTAEPHYEGDWKLTQEQKDEIREDYAAAMRGEVVDARTALEEIRSSLCPPTPGELSEEMKREILQGWNEALRGEVVDMETVLEEIRREHGF